MRVSFHRRRPGRGREILLTVWGILVAGCSHLQQLGLEPSREERSGNYTLYTDLGRNDRAKIFEVARKAHAQLLEELGGDPGKAYELVVFSQREDLERFVSLHRLAFPLEPAGFFCPEGGEGVALWQAARELSSEENSLMNTYLLSHELVHQFLGRQWDHVPREVWVGEGLPDHLSVSHDEAADVLALEVLASAGYLYSLKSLVETPLPVEKIGNALRWMVIQSEGHLLFDFLREGRDGRYKDRFRAWLRRFVRKEVESHSLLRAIAIESETLEGEWRDFVEDRYLAYVGERLRSGNPKQRARFLKTARRLTGLALADDSPESAFQGFDAWRRGRRNPLGLVRLVGWDEFLSRLDRIPVAFACQDPSHSPRLVDVKLCPACSSEEGFRRDAGGSGFSCAACDRRLDPALLKCPECGREAQGLQSLPRLPPLH